MFSGYPHCYCMLFVIEYRIKTSWIMIIFLDKIFSLAESFVATPKRYQKIQWQQAWSGDPTKKRKEHSRNIQRKENGFITFDYMRMPGIEPEIICMLSDWAPVLPCIFLFVLLDFYPALSHKQVPFSHWWIHPIPFKAF